jgi:hypothetical protein
LSNPKSFTRRDFEPLLQQYNDLLTNLRASTPTTPEPTTPSTISRRPSTQTPVQQERQTYWNEFNDRSDVENEPYTIYVDPDADFQIFGAKNLAHLFSKARGPMEKVRPVREWLGPMGSPRERRPLLQDTGYFTRQTETDVDDASSSEFPSCYAAHYTTFPSIDDERFSRSRERLLFRLTVASFAAALVLLIASLLVATGRHKLRIEVDAGATVGMVFSLFFAALGVGTMLYRSEKLSWLHRSCVAVTFVAVCILNGIMLVIVIGNTGL